MGRPPGAKNKPKNMESNDMNEPKVFNYEDELQNQGMTPAWREVSVNEQSVAVTPTYFVEDNVDTTHDTSSKLFLVEGLVQLRPLQPGRQPVQAEQNRIVYAMNVDHAIQKYNQYFASLSNAHEIYVVLRASASEAIM
jgi:hypothetical protein